ncbi:hypothetical protein GCM10009687_23150 [Asanoa iriomotensis]|uniref:hypothetical protein n=1 Tax=Asanoa iriomotensis TaxID=234613 RepID=UPI0031DBD476
MSQRPGEWVVIELGTAHGSVDEEQVPGSRHRRRSWRSRLAATTGALVLVCGGAATASPPFRPTAAVPVEAGSSVSVAGDLLLVADPAPVPATLATSAAGGTAAAGRIAPGIRRPRRHAHRPWSLVTDGAPEPGFGIPMILPSCSRM